MATTRAPDITCDQCRFWDDGNVTEYSSAGKCRIRAKEGGRPWPMTHADDWCGEGERKCDA